MDATIAREIKDFVVANFLFGQDDRGLTDEQSFLENGDHRFDRRARTGGVRRAALQHRDRRSRAAAGKPRFCLANVEPVRVRKLAPPGQPGRWLTTSSGGRASPTLTGARLRDRRLTYGEIDAAVDRVAGGLRALGVRPGDRVADPSREQRRSRALDLRRAQARAAFVPIGRTAKADKLAYILHDCDATAWSATPRRRRVQDALRVAPSAGRGECSRDAAGCGRTVRDGCCP